MKKIKLTQNKYALVDDVDFEVLNQYKWHLNNNYACRNNGWGKNKIFMHREILNTPVNMQTDHINRNKLDNQKSNLRICDYTQNNANKIKLKNNTTGFKGVFILKSNKGKNEYITASIKVNKKRIHLGVFKDLIKAAKAYNEAALEHFGQFASLNKV